MIRTDLMPIADFMPDDDRTTFDPNEDVAFLGPDVEEPPRAVFGVQLSLGQRKRGAADLVLTITQKIGPEHSSFIVVSNAGDRFEFRHQDVPRAKST